MKLYFIQNIHTKLYFPDPKGRNGRGGSFTTATDNGNDARIFRSELSAKRFLGAWLKGEYHHGSGVDYDHEGNVDYYEDITIVPKEDRNRDDYEIILKEIIL